MKAFITKYVPTKGIQEIEATSCGIGYPYMIREIAGSWPRYFHKGEWFHTREEAVADAEKRRIRKIASLKKQITKLEAMKFSSK